MDLINNKIALSTTPFWDVNMKDLDLEKNARFIIERVFVWGTLTDIAEVIIYYGKDKIKEELKKSKNLNKKTISLICAYFEMNRKEFLCS